MENRCCARCQAELDSSIEGGICPACLLEQGLGAGQGGSFAGTTGRPTSGGGITTPSLEELVEAFPQLEIIDWIGSGGMGAVYRARQRSLDRVVALKVLPREIAQSAEFEERFSREAKMLARLNHPNIVTVFESGQSGSWYYLLMEYVDGINLRQASQTGTLESGEVLGVIQQVCDALQYAHEEGVIHRDIKPENILLDQRGRVRIADFGLAKLLASPEDVSLTRTRQVVGTWHYMAPEQWEQPQKVDHRADLYSLGVVLYELLTGHLPVGRFEMPSETRPSDAAMDPIVLKALEREPGRRYQRASELKSDLSSAPPVVSPPVTDPVPDPVRHVESGRTPAVAFTLVAQGNEVGSGIARIEGDHLMLEYQVGWSVYWVHYGQIRHGFYETGLPLDRVNRVSLRSRLWGYSIDIQTESVRLVNKIPGHRQGGVELRIARKDHEAGRQLVQEIEQRIGQAPAGSPAEVVHREIEAEKDEDRFQVLALVGWLMLALGATEMFFGFQDASKSPGDHERNWAFLLWLQGSMGLVGGWAVLNRSCRWLSHFAAAVMVIPLSSVTFIPGFLLAIWYFNVAGVGVNWIYRERSLEVPNAMLRFLGARPHRKAPIPKRLAIAAVLQMLVALLTVWGSMTYCVYWTWDGSWAADYKREEYFEYNLAYFPALLLGAAAGWLTLRRDNWHAALAFSLVGLVPLGFGALSYWPFALLAVCVLLTSRSRRWFRGDVEYPIQSAKPLPGDKPSVIRSLKTEPSWARFGVVSGLLGMVAMVNVILSLLVVATLFGADWLPKGLPVIRGLSHPACLVGDGSMGMSQLSGGELVGSMVPLLAQGAVNGDGVDGGGGMTWRGSPNGRLSPAGAMVVLFAIGSLGMALLLGWASLHVALTHDRRAARFAGFACLLPLHLGVVIGLPVGLAVLALMSDDGESGG